MATWCSKLWTEKWSLYQEKRIKQKQNQRGMSGGRDIIGAPAALIPDCGLFLSLATLGSLCCGTPMFCAMFPFAVKQALENVCCLTPKASCNEYKWKLHFPLCDLIIQKFQVPYFSARPSPTGSSLTLQEGHT